MTKTGDLPVIMDVTEEMHDEVFSVVCPYCDSQIDEACLVQIQLSGRQAVTLHYLGEDQAHIQRVLETTIVDSIWIDSPNPLLRQRWEEYTADNAKRLRKALKRASRAE